MCGLCGNGCSAWDWETTGYALLNSTELEVLPPTRICTESHPRSSLLRSPHPLSALFVHCCASVTWATLVGSAHPHPLCDFSSGGSIPHPQPLCASSGVPLGLFCRLGVGAPTPSLCTAVEGPTPVAVA